MKFKEERTVFLTMQQANELIEKELERICGHSIPCYIKMEDWDYWAVIFRGYRMPISELYFVFEKTEADELTRRQSLTEEPMIDVDSIGPLLTASLLSRATGFCWEQDLAMEDGIWLIGVDKRKVEAERRFVYKDLALDIGGLMSKDEMLKYIEENGGDYEALAGIGNQYLSLYGNCLYWHYPIVSDGLYAGTYIILVKEGALALPYILVNERNYEEFYLEGAELLDPESMDVLIGEWNLFSNNLFGAMNAIRRMLVHRKENKTGENI